MKEPTRPNYFLLLALNPDEPWEPALYQKALQDKIRQWSRESMSVAKKALPAQANRALLPHIREVMEDPALRNKEAEEARKLLADSYQAAHAHFEVQLMLLNLKEAVKQEEIDRFIQDFKHIHSPQEIRKLITARIQPAYKDTDRLPQPLDASMTKNIEDRLAMLHMQTLYQFLGSPPGSTTTELFQAAEALYACEVRQHPTAEVTARIELAGFAMNLFKTNEKRARYDETLRQRSLQLLLHDIAESTKRSAIKEVHPRQVLYYIKKAREAGWSEEEALEQLKVYARLQQWCIMVPLPAAEMPDGTTSITGPVESVRPPQAQRNEEDVRQSRFSGTMRRNVRRRVLASLLMLAQLACFSVLLHRSPGFFSTMLQFLILSNQAHSALLALCVEGFGQYTQTQLAAHVPATTLHTSVAVLSLLLTLLINSLFIVLILSPGIPILCIVIGLVSGGYIGLRNLGKRLVTAHLRLSRSRKAARKKSITLQPAQKIYPFEQGWIIENQVAEEIVVTFHKLKQNWSTTAEIVADWKWRRNRLIRYWVDVVKIGCLLAGLVQSVLSLEIATLCTCLYTTLLLLWEAGVLLCIGFLRVVQVLHPGLRSRALSCPDCHHTITLPLSICSACVTECPRRGPGLYGIFWYRCQGCWAKLPTLNFSASRGITHLCPYCRHVLQ